MQQEEEMSQVSSGTPFFCTVPRDNCRPVGCPSRDHPGDTNFRAGGKFTELVHWQYLVIFLRVEGIGNYPKALRAMHPAVCTLARRE
jgi:hypothetical protein